MATGVGSVSDPRAPKPRRPTSRTTPDRRRRHRFVLAALASILATVALCVPLGYQAYAARQDGPPTAPGTPTTSSSAPPTTATTVPTRVLPTTLERGDADLTWASTLDDPAPRPLEGATLSGRVVVQLRPVPDSAPIRSVEFWVDKIDEGRPPLRVDEVAPFTLDDGPPDGPGTIDTNELDDGTHVVVVLAVQDGGSTVELTSRFHVDNG